MMRRSTVYNFIVAYLCLGQLVNGQEVRMTLQRSKHGVHLARRDKETADVHSEEQKEGDDPKCGRWRSPSQVFYWRAGFLVVLVLAERRVLRVFSVICGVLVVVEPNESKEQSVGTHIRRAHDAKDNQTVDALGG